MSDDNNEQGDQALADEWAAALAEEAPAKPAAGKNAAPDLDVILDIPVRISMEVGSSSITIRNLLQLNQGTLYPALLSIGLVMMPLLLYPLLSMTLQRFLLSAPRADGAARERRRPAGV